MWVAIGATVGYLVSGVGSSRSDRLRPGLGALHGFSKMLVLKPAKSSDMFELFDSFAYGDVFWVVSGRRRPP